MQGPSDEQPDQLAARAPSGGHGGGQGEPAARERALPPAPTPEQIAARALASVPSGPRLVGEAAVREIPREFGAGRRVETLWWRAASLRSGCPLVCVSSADGGVGRSVLTLGLGGLLALPFPTRWWRSTQPCYSEAARRQYTAPTPAPGVDAAGWVGS